MQTVETFFLWFAGAACFTIAAFFLYIILRLVFGKTRRPQIDDVPVKHMRVVGKELVEVEEVIEHQK